MENSKLHIAILVSPGMGHLIPNLLLANRLVDLRDEVEVTLLVVTAHSSLAESHFSPYLTSKFIRVVTIPPPDISSLVGPTTGIITILRVIMSEVRPVVRDAISAMSPRPDVLIVDSFSSESLDIANEFKMGKYLYIPMTAGFLALTTYLPVLDKTVDGQYVDQNEPLKIPGCKSIRPEDVIDVLVDRNDQQYHEFVQMGTEYPLVDGILLNTWEDLEPTSLQSLRDDNALLSVVKVPVYPIGPLTKSTEAINSNKLITSWLDEQPADSVIYVSFGSGGTLSAEQTTELAWGLELSRQRFVWIVRPPINGSADTMFFTLGNGNSLDGTPDYLPNGFLTRTRDFGRVVTNWAPQVEILNHKSVGGFLTHCGWNSTLESIKGGVPMIAWPLFAEQRMNAVMLVEELGTALRPAAWPVKNLVRRDEVESLVRTLMECNEGRLVRDRVRKLTESGEEAFSKNGSSCRSINKFLKKCYSRVYTGKAEK